MFAGGEANMTMLNQLFPNMAPRSSSTHYRGKTRVSIALVSSPHLAHIGSCTAGFVAVLKIK